MRKYNKLIGLIILIYILSTSFIFYVGNEKSKDVAKEYKIEINRIYEGLAKNGSFAKPNLASYNFVREVTFLDIKDEGNKNKIDKFYRTNNSTEIIIKPLYLNEDLIGYVRFDYEGSNSANNTMLITQVVILFFVIFILIIMTYIKKSIIKPFNELKNMPYELAKGNLKGDIKESHNKYFGKFIWGINLLRDNLNSYKFKEIRLQREKKLILLSISHDIKTPLSAIKLYSKALETGLYETEEKKKMVAKQIGEKSIEIDDFVNDIIKASSEDIIDIQVTEGVFYLEELVTKVNRNYQEKCSLMMIKLIIEKYENKLIQGDIERAFEVCGNIIENAMKYGDGKYINISFYEEEECQLIKIYNSGKVIASQEFNHIFDSFFRGSNSEGKQGNGLGLYICREIMRKMDGEIFAQCEELGMSFILVLQK